MYFFVIACSFCRITRLPHQGGRPSMLSPRQETLIVDMVRQNNSVKLCEIQQKIIDDHVDFEGITSISISTIDRVLKRNRMRMKQLYRVPFERNSERVKEQRFHYVQRVFQLDSSEQPHEYIYMDEAGFNLTKRRRRGRNVIGQRAIVTVPGQRGGNVTLCAAISNHGVLHHHATLGPYNTQHLLTFLSDLRDIVLGFQQQDHEQTEHPVYVIVWDNVSFHHAVQVREWFTRNQEFLNVFLPPYSPFLNPTEEFFSAWRWKVYDRQPYTRENLLQAMELACNDIGVDACQAWIRHTRSYYPRCLARENVAYDVDEVLWPDPAHRHDVIEYILYALLL
ncbi:uncharacterized protein LOC125804931 [Astyanax mexicanus]|uniref:uncharacterized protein LOC125804931 n=2 Tax=Astyanax mexicanus TaxID=7994 RepID=UPI0020CB1B31|nr:uncharacterized protein LOC125804931 [Astyanax mexicanus]